jgi:hypothetical protein
MNDFATSPDELGPVQRTGYLRVAGRLAKGRVVGAKHVIIDPG